MIRKTLRERMQKKLDQLEAFAAGKGQPAGLDWVEMLLLGIVVLFIFAMPFAISTGLIYLAIEAMEAVR